MCVCVWFVISNESMGLRNSEQRTKEFDDPQVFDNPKGISIGSMDFNNPKVFGDTSIFDSLVLDKFSPLGLG